MADMDKISIIYRYGYDAASAYSWYRGYPQQVYEKSIVSIKGAIELSNQLDLKPNQVLSLVENSFKPV